jgi:hypothetical protein
MPWGLRPCGSRFLKAPGSVDMYTNPYLKTENQLKYVYV